MKNNFVQCEDSWNVYILIFHCIPSIQWYHHIFVLCIEYKIYNQDLFFHWYKCNNKVHHFQLHSFNMSPFYHQIRRNMWFYLKIKTCFSIDTTVTIKFTIFNVTVSIWVLSITKFIATCDLWTIIHAWTFGYLQIKSSFTFRASKLLWDHIDH